MAVFILYDNKAPPFIFCNPPHDPSSCSPTSGDVCHHHYRDGNAIERKWREVCMHVEINRQQEPSDDEYQPRYVCQSGVPLNPSVQSNASPVRRELTWRHQVAWPGVTNAQKIKHVQRSSRRFCPLAILQKSSKPIRVDQCRPRHTPIRKSDQSYHAHHHVCGWTLVSNRLRCKETQPPQPSSCLLRSSCNS